MTDIHLDYFRRMGVEPTPYGIARWLEREIEITGEFDHKYFRRLVDALIRVCGGNPDLAYELAAKEEAVGT